MVRRVQEAKGQMGLSSQEHPCVPDIIFIVYSNQPRAGTPYDGILLLSNKKVRTTDTHTHRVNLKSTMWSERSQTQKTQTGSIYMKF